MCQKAGIKKYSLGDKSDSPGSVTSREQECVNSTKITNGLGAGIDLSVHFTGQAQSQLILSQTGLFSADKDSKNLLKISPRDKLDNSGLAWNFLGKQGQSQTFFAEMFF